MNLNINKVLELIIGKEEYESVINKAAKEYQDGNYSLEHFEVILESYFIAILLIGFSKKKIDIDKYAIHLLNKPDIIIDTREFCENYKKYIDKVEDYKFRMLRELIKDERR